MSDFTVRSDSVNVEHIMEQIRARIREKRGVDYTEQQIRELASVKLEKFLDPRVVRSDLLQQFQRAQAADTAPSITFGPNAIFESHRPIVATIRRLLRPVLRLFFNPDPISQALVRLGDIDPKADMYYEILHNLVIELTRTGIEVKNLKMRVESLTGRLEFNERRARALESVVAYNPSASEPPPTPVSTPRVPAGESSTGRRGGGYAGGPRSSGSSYGSSVGSRQSSGSSRPESSPATVQAAPAAPVPPASAEPTPSAGPAAGATGQPPEGPGQRSRRRRRRRGRRSSGPAAEIMGASTGAGLDASPSDGESDGNDPAPPESSGDGVAFATDRSGAHDSEAVPDAGHDPSGRSDPSEQ